MTDKGDARRAQIVTAARGLILEHGFSRLTVSDIAAGLGMTRSLFYHYFPGKDALADAVLDDVIGEILQRLEAWNATRPIGNVDSFVDDVTRLTRTIIADESPFSRRMVAEGNAELYLKFIDRAADRIADYLGEATARDFEVLHDRPISNMHETLFMLIVGLISLIRSHPDIPDATLRTIVAQTLHIAPTR